MENFIIIFSEKILKDNKIKNWKIEITENLKSNNAALCIHETKTILYNSHLCNYSEEYIKDIKPPQSLKNIYKCIENTCGTEMDYNNGDLTHWCKQGVLLLNTSFTLFEKISNSHKHIWKGFSVELLSHISENTDKVIFLLWGNEAKKLKKVIDNDKHYILEHSHPSPLSRKSFVECDHFVKTNEILQNMNQDPIVWIIKSNKIYYK